VVTLLLSRKIRRFLELEASGLCHAAEQDG
jgi:hypothetical protein